MAGTATPDLLPPPRLLAQPLSFWRAAPTSLILAAILIPMGVITVVLFGLIFGDPTLGFRLDARHEIGAATILRLERTSVHSGGYYWRRAHYTLELPDGRQYPGDSLLDSRSRERRVRSAFEAGETLPAEYLPEDPTVSRLAGTPTHWVPFLLCGMGLSMLLVGLFAWGYGRRLRERYRRLLTVGEMVLGEVTRVSTLWYVNVGRRHPVVIGYRFRTAMGHEVTGAETTLRQEALGEYAVGGAIRICHDAARPKLAVAPDVLGVVFR